MRNIPGFCPLGNMLTEIFFFQPVANDHGIHHESKSLSAQTKYISEMQAQDCSLIRLTKCAICSIKLRNNEPNFLTKPYEF